ncbi:hypothetical protein V3391_05415 [Luteimonas sp. SMYT11W]|uniref:Sel1 repeat family protein n=1 Tax=Luteimonas flava TaxID=3115822 RepID=A0ABU7WDD7_9GAMM
MIRQRLIVGASVVAAGLLVAALLVRNTDADAGVVSAENVAGSASDASVGTNRSAIPDGPFDSQRVQLEAAAANGDAHAAFRLGQAIAHCLNYSPVASGRAAQRMAELIAQAGTHIRIGDRPLGDERSIDMVLFAQQEGERLCTDTDSLRTTPPTLDAFHYIAQAAQAGHPGAAALYPDLAFREFRTPAELIENADEVERRRERARSYLLRSVRSGAPEALLAASKAYSADGWLARDPEQALAYWLTYAATDDFRRIPESLANERTAELEGMATASQRERAAAQAARIMGLSGGRADAQ